MLSIIETTLGSSVADGATTTVSYPTGTSRGVFIDGIAHEASVNGNRYRTPTGVLVTPGASNIVITNNTGSAWPIGTFLRIGVDQPGSTNIVTDSGASVKRCVAAPVFVVNFGTPPTAVANGIAASQSVGAGANALINGSLAASGVVTLEIPRNVVAAWTGTSIATVRGFDEYDQPMTESSASGTSLTGKKAFKRITRVSFSAAVTLATVGTGVELGLPVAVMAASQVRNDTNSEAGTVTAADLTTNKPSATSGDVRGTVSFTNAPNGSRSYRLYISLADPVSIGPAPFTA